MSKIAGGSVVWNLDVNSSNFNQGLSDAKTQLKDFKTELKDTEERAVKSFSDALKNAEGSSRLFLGGAVAAGAGIGGLISKTVLTAARTETLGVAMNAIAKATGTSIEELAKQEKQLKDQGIATQEARQILSLFMQSELDVAQASKIARVAQDLAVISGGNSSETANTLTQAITTQSAELLRQFGITKTSVQIFDEYAASSAKSADSLTDLEKKQAFMNLIMAEGEKVAGTYESAMETPGKKLGSLDRHIQNASNTIGVVFLPAFGNLIDAFTEFLKQITAENVQKALDVLTEWAPVIIGFIVGGVTPALYWLARAFLVALTPLLPFIAAGVLIGIVVKKLIESLGGWDNVMKTLQPTLDLMGTVFKTLILPQLQGLWDQIKNKLLPALKDLWDVLQPVIIPVLKVLGAIIGGLLVGAIIVFITAIRLITFAITTWVDFIKWGVEEVFGFFKWLFDVLVGHSLIPDMINGIIDWFRSLPDKIKGALSGLTNVLTRPFTDAWGQISKVVDKIKTGLDRINPFHRESPSLVQNVRKGLDIIGNEYAKLGQMILPSPAFDIGVANAFNPDDFGSGKTINQSIKIDVGSVGDMQDVEAIGRELGFRTNMLLGVI